MAGCATIHSVEFRQQDLPDFDWYILGKRSLLRL
jgi:hypothetical protein